MFTTYRVPPLRRGGLGEGVRPGNALFAAARRAIEHLSGRVSLVAGQRAKAQGKCGSKLANVG